ncbi:MAG TPA: ABC transporter permease [Blastocatellia bacterium]|nr:ABC transporter permease [Blastocatellia bacterium]
MPAHDHRKEFFSRPHLWLIALAGVIVPRRLRADWRQEWEAELRYRETLLADWDKLDWRNKLDLVRRSVGAFLDALWLQPRRLEDEMFQDLRYGARMLLRQRAFTIAAVIALALGIGANTAVFSVVNAVLLRPLPYQNSDRIAMIWGNFLLLKIEQLTAKAAEYVDYRDQTQSFETVASFHKEDFVLTGGSQAERVAGARVTANLFPMLGAKAALGRLISAEENQTGRDNVMVVSHKFWQTRLGGEPNVIGRNVRLSDSSYTIIGVTPAGFEFPHPSFNFTGPVEFWIPLTFTTEQVTQRQDPYYLNVIALLKPNVTIEQARAEMTALGRRFERELGFRGGYLGPNNESGGWRITVMPLQEQVVGNSRRALLVLFAAVGLVLLIACANAANLLLMRSTVRQKEMAIRAAMGAHRLRLIRQLLTESLLIAALGAAGGLTLASLGVKTLVALGPDNLPRLQEIDVDGRVLFFTLALSVLTGLIFGLAPALQASRPRLQHTLKEGGAAATRGRHWLRNLLVVSEVAIAMTLLVGAGLMLNSFVRLQRVDTVVDVDKTLTVEINLPSTKYTEPAQVTAFFQELVRGVKSLPGVEQVSLSNVMPLGANALNDPFAIEGRAYTADNATWAAWQAVMPNYFRTLGIPFVAGQDFTERDNAEAPGTAIINESMARRYFPNENPIGKRIALGKGPPWLTIVGVVKDIRQRGLESEAGPDWYFPYPRRPIHYAYLLLRTSGDRVSLASAVRSQISAIDKDQPVAAIKTLNEVIASTTAPRRFNTLLIAIFAAVALALATVGIYSVISYSVTQRTQEVGVRMALGARPGDVIRLVLKQGLTLTLIGGAVGVLGAIAAARVMSGLLYDVTATDPATFVAISLLLAIVAMLACYLPARRAARVEPIAALRCE